MLVMMFAFPATSIADAPRVSGAFLQLNQSNAKAGQPYWDRQLSGMNELGMDTAIIQYVAYDQFCHYPTEVAGMVASDADVVMQILNAARDVEIKVFLGLQLDSGFWDQQFDLPARVQLNIAIMNELHQRYGGHVGLGGWYLPEEIDDLTSNQPYANDLIEYLGRLTTRASELSQLPVMISPFFSADVDASAYARWWDEKVLPRVNLTILALQDGVGTHRTKISGVARVYQTLAPVMDRHQAHFWANVEAFDQTSGWPVNQEPWSASSASVDQFKRQVLTTAPFTSKTILFEYTQYVSPDVSSRAAALFRACKSSAKLD